MVVLPQGVQFIGNGCELYLRDNTHPGDSDSSNGFTFIKMEKGSSIYNMKINGNRAANKGNTNGLYLKGGLSGVRDGFQVVDGCEIHDIWSYLMGIYASDGVPTNIRINNNKIYNTNQYGICTGCTDGPYCYGHNVYVTNNLIYECDQCGIKIRGTHDSFVTGNTIYVGRHVGDEPAGIRLYTWDEENDNVVIDNNVIIGRDEDPSQGIKGDSEGSYGMTWATGSKRMKIRGNQISHCHNGIIADLGGAIITGNAITNCAQGMSISAEPGNPNTISGNTCDGSPCSGS